jgi:DNA invertase Pin-like site-specific DNA recombinase
MKAMPPKKKTSSRPDAKRAKLAEKGKARAGRPGKAKAAPRVDAAPAPVAPQAKTIACAIYARVSTTDKGQDVENQLLQLREYCARSGWKISKEYIDRVSGKTGERDAFKQLFEDAARRKFDVVLVWALDRFTREGVYETFDYVRKLTLNGVDFESYTEAHFRTTGPAGELMLAIAAWIAKQERLRISERTKAGIERARRAGKHCGRPYRVFRKDLAREMKAEGMSLRAIAEKLGVSFMTVKRVIDAEKPGV